MALAYRSVLEFGLDPTAALTARGFADYFVPVAMSAAGQAMRFLHRPFHIRRDFVAAEHSYRRALDRAYDAYVLFGYGWLLSQMGRRAEAAETLEKAVDLDPRSALMHNDLGRWLYGARRFDRATSALETRGRARRARECLGGGRLLPALSMARIPSVEFRPAVSGGAAETWTALAAGSEVDDFAAALGPVRRDIGLFEKAGLHRMSLAQWQMTIDFSADPSRPPIRHGCPT